MHVEIPMEILDVSCPATATQDNMTSLRRTHFLGIKVCQAMH